jgi:hypothetical protein
MSLDPEARKEGGSGSLGGMGGQAGASIATIGTEFTGGALDAAPSNVAPPSESPASPRAPVRDEMTSENAPAASWLAGAARSSGVEGASPGSSPERGPFAASNPPHPQRSVIALAR